MKNGKIIYRNDSYDRINEINVQDTMPKLYKKQNSVIVDKTINPIELVCDNLKSFLLEKNKRYGNSALEPVRIFSKADTSEQIKVRLDDKINRIKNSTEDRKNDYLDLMGYLVLFMVKKDWNNFDEFLD